MEKLIRQKASTEERARGRGGGEDGPEALEHKEKLRCPETDPQAKHL